MAEAESDPDRPRADFYYRKLVDGGMIYDGATGSVHHFNLTAARIWEACLLGKVATEIVADLVGEFELATESAEADVEATLAAFRESGLFEP